MLSFAAVLSCQAEKDASEGKSIRLEFSLSDTKVAFNADRTAFIWEGSDAVTVLNDAGRTDLVEDTLRVLTRTLDIGNREVLAVIRTEEWRPSRRNLGIRTDTRERASARHVDVSRLLEGFVSGREASGNALAEHVEVGEIIDRVRTRNSLAEVLGPAEGRAGRVKTLVRASRAGERLLRAVGVLEGERDGRASWNREMRPR